MSKPDATAGDWAKSVAATAADALLDYALVPKERRAQKLALSPLGHAIGRGLARLARVPRPPFRWRIADGPWFESTVGTLELDTESAVLRIEWCLSDGRLEQVLERRL